MRGSKLGMGMSSGGGTSREKRMRRSFPTVEDPRQRARRRIPGFAFEYADCGVGLDLDVKANRTALDAIELVPRCGIRTAVRQAGLQAAAEARALTVRHPGSLQF